MSIIFDMEIPLTTDPQNTVLSWEFQRWIKKNWENNTPVYFLPYPMFITGMSGDLLNCKHMNTAINTFLYQDT